MARDTSRLTRACEIAISRRPSSQIGSDTLSEMDDTLPALGKKLDVEPHVLADEARSGRYCPRSPLRNADAARSLARAARYWGPCATASWTASAKPERQVRRPGRIHRLGVDRPRPRRCAARAGGARPEQRRRAAAGRCRAWVSSSTSWSESLWTAAPDDDPGARDAQALLGARARARAATRASS